MKKSRQRLWIKSKSGRNLSCKLVKTTCSLLCILLDIGWQLWSTKSAHQPWLTCRVHIFFIQQCLARCSIDFLFFFLCLKYDHNCRPSPNMIVYIKEYSIWESREILNLLFLVHLWAKFGQIEVYANRLQQISWFCVNCQQQKAHTSHILFAELAVRVFDCLCLYALFCVDVSYIFHIHTYSHWCACYDC